MRPRIPAARDRQRRLAALCAAAAIAAGCASALPPLRSDDALLRGDAADPAAAAELMEGARTGFAQRPDRAAVRESADLAVRAALAAPHDPEAVILAVRARVWLASHRDSDTEAESLAQEAVRIGQTCRVRAPDHDACDYWLALAVGIQADIRRSTALDGLDVMVRLLRESIDTVPAIDHAGPYRVLARVLVNAPGWPAGPGDADEGVEMARAAVKLAPGWPPNHLALGEALEEVGNPTGARASYETALEAALAARESGQPDAEEWIAEARRALARS